MTHYILLHVHIPKQSEPEYLDEWRPLALRLSELAHQSEGIAQLGENVWLLPRKTGMPFAAACMEAARARRLQVSARFLTEDDS